MASTTNVAFDPKDLEAKVKAMYGRVAEDPHGEFHFEMGRTLAERLGYAAADLDCIPAEAIDSFAGVGFHFDLAYLKVYIEDPSLPEGFADAVISNGVINLAPDKAAVFRQAARILKRGGRLAVSDIVTERQLPETVVCNANLWAACIGGAMQHDSYRAAIETAGLRIRTVRNNPGYRFLSHNAQSAQEKWGVNSISLLAIKP